MKERIIKIIIVLLIIACIFAGFVFYGIYVAPSSLRITHESIASNKIPAAMNDVNIAFISDVHYGEFMDKNRFKKMIDELNLADPDIVVFGGDLFTDPVKEGTKQTDINDVTEILNSINAPLGKFYVLGEDDLKTSDTRTFVSNILYNSGFEDLTNRSIKVHNGTVDSITLIGLDSSINGNPDITSAFANTSSDGFNIVFTHVPDELANVPNDSADLAFAGHSHGGQISLPLIGPVSSSAGCTKFESGIYNTGNLQICISNGIGTTGVDMRLFSPAEIVIYRLIAKS